MGQLIDERIVQAEARTVAIDGIKGSGMYYLHLSTGNKHIGATKLLVE